MRLEGNYSSFPSFSGLSLPEIHEFNPWGANESHESFELRIAGIREIRVIRWLNNPPTTPKPCVSFNIVTQHGD
jgi:hypothetical protein